MSIYRPSNAIYQLLQQSQVSETPGSMAQGHHHATRFQLSQAYFPGRRAKSSVWMASMMAWFEQSENASKRGTSGNVYEVDERQS